MTNMICKKRGCSVIVESELELHHLVPKFMGGTDADGRRYLCKKHHDVITKITPKIIFSFIPVDKQKTVRKAVKEYTEKWLSQQ